MIIFKNYQLLIILSVVPIFVFSALVDLFKIRIDVTNNYVIQSEFNYRNEIFKMINNNNLEICQYFTRYYKLSIY